MLNRLLNVYTHRFSRQHVFAFLVLFLLLWRIPYYGKVILDDPYITFEYAKNLVEFGQLTYNLDDYVLATTTPLYTFLMALFYALGFELPTAATILNLISEVALLYILGLLFSEFSSFPRANLSYAIAGMLTISNRTFSIASQSGLETPLFVLSISIALLFVLRRRYTGASVAGSLAILTRPDGVFVLILLGMTVLVRERRFPLKETVLSLLIGLPWVMVALSLYGSFIPHSVTAKAAIQPIWGSSFFGKLNVMFYEPFRLFSFIYVAALLVGMWRLKRSLGNPSVRIVLALFALFFVYVLLPVNAGFEWYFAPLIFLFHMIIGLGLLELRQAKMAVVMAGALLIGISYSSLGNYLSVKTIDEIWQDGMFQVIDHLNTGAKTSSVVQCTNIGILGYYTDLEILDPLGLASPQILPLIQEASDLADLYQRVAAEFRPDYVISFDEQRYEGYVQEALYPTSAMPLIVYTRLDSG